MAVLDIKDAKKALENAPEGAQYWTPGYDIEYRKVISNVYHGWNGVSWEISKDGDLSKERIDKGYPIEELKKMANDLEITNHIDVNVTTTFSQSNEEFGLPFLVDENDDESFFQQVGRSERKLGPKDGEWWLGYDKGSERCARLRSNDSWFASLDTKAIEDNFTPISRLYTTEEHSSTERQCQEHEKTVTRLVEGLGDVADICIDRGMKVGDDALKYVIGLLESYDNKDTLPIAPLYPLVEDAYYMCNFKFNNLTATEPLKWKGGGFFFGATPLSQTDNDPEVLYRMTKRDPELTVKFQELELELEKTKEQLAQKEHERLQVLTGEHPDQQLEGLPSIGSVVFIIPNRNAGGGKPGFSSGNAGRKVRIHSHFIDDRGTALAAYVTNDDGQYKGGVACATAFETFKEKEEREKAEWFDGIREEIGYSDDEEPILNEMYRLGYRKVEKNND